MYCSKCGEKVEDDASFCSHCGANLKVTEKKESKPYSQFDNTPRTGMGVILGLFLGLIGLAIGLNLYPQGTVARKTFLKAWGIAFGIISVIFLIAGIVLCVVLMNNLFAVSDF